MQDRVTANSADELTNLTVERINYRFHPFLGKFDGLHRFPFLMGELLQAREGCNFQEAHIISASRNGYSVDGFKINSELTSEEKTAAALEAIKTFCEKVQLRKINDFEGGSVRVAGAHFKYPEERRPRFARILSLTEKPYFAQHAEGNECTHFVVAFKKFEAFAMRMQWSRVRSLHCYKAKKLTTDMMMTLLLNGAEKVELDFPISEDFFNNPSPENVKYFGEVAFLAQARREWSTPNRAYFFSRETLPLKPQYIVEADLNAVGRYLKKTTGAESYLKHAGVETLVWSESVQMLWRFTTQIPASSQ
jgi:hypothetical protein